MKDWNNVFNRNLLMVWILFMSKNVGPSCTMSLISFLNFASINSIDTTGTSSKSRMTAASEFMTTFMEMSVDRGSSSSTKFLFRVLTNKIKYYFYRLRRFESSSMNNDKTLIGSKSYIVQVIFNINNTPDSRWRKVPCQNSKRVDGEHRVPQLARNPPAHRDQPELLALTRVFDLDGDVFGERGQPLLKWTFVRLKVGALRNDLCFDLECKQRPTLFQAFKETQGWRIGLDKIC